MPPATAKIALSGDWFYEWGGAQRWLKTNEKNQDVFSLTENLKGHASLFRARDRSAELFQPLSDSLKKISRNIKNAFDPKGILNPYRLYRDW